MKLTPQELMDLPYVGMAEQKLRAQGDWTLTGDEELDAKMKQLDSLEDMRDEIEELRGSMRDAIEALEYAL